MINLGRRRFLEEASAAVAAMGLAACPSAGVSEAAQRPLTTLGRAVDWINTPRMTSSSLAGKVVLVDFWTYTCINWLRTLPYVRAWARQYRQQLVVIGVHTPEFAFEHDLDNVRRAVQRLGIDYPIVVDNDYAIWRAFNNHYWPARYLIDSRGRMRHQRFGEGEYEESESAMRRVLSEHSGAMTDQSSVRVEPSGVEIAADWTNLRSPENYMGYQRTEGFASPGGARPGRRHTYAAPARLTRNQWALIGDWMIESQAIRSLTPNARIVTCFHARDVHLVLKPSQREQRVRFRISIDGRTPGAAHGLDTDTEGSGTLAEPRLYQLIRQLEPVVDRRIDIEFIDSGAEAFAFTFG